jgi:hypothetical protein
MIFSSGFCFASMRPQRVAMLLLLHGIMGGLVCPSSAPAGEGDAPQGYRELFDGLSLAGWHTEPRLPVPKTATEFLAAQDDATPATVPKSRIQEAQSKAKGRWEVKDGVITGGQDRRRFKHEPDGESWGLGSWLMTDETFGDFELRLDAKPDWPCDTGIYVRTTRLGQGFQILLDHRGDDTSGTGGGIGFLYLRGIGGMLVNPWNFRWTLGPNGLPHDVQLLAGAGESSGLKYFAGTDLFRKAWHMNDWNNFRIRVEGALPRITVWINKVLICECDTAEIHHPSWDPASVKKLLGTRGHIALEVHDGPPWRWGIGKVCRWKNVFVRPL